MEYSKEIKMSNWNKAKKLMKKLFDSGWLKLTYGQIESCGKEVSYPLSYEDTEFLVDFFKNNDKKRGI